MRLRQLLRQSPAMANRRREGVCLPAGVLRDAPAQAGKRLADTEAVCLLSDRQPAASRAGFWGRSLGLHLVKLTFYRVCVGYSQ